MVSSCSPQFVLFSSIFSKSAHEGAMQDSRNGLTNTEEKNHHLSPSSLLHTCKEALALSGWFPWQNLTSGFFPLQHSKCFPGCSCTSVKKGYSLHPLTFQSFKVLWFRSYKNSRCSVRAQLFLLLSVSQFFGHQQRLLTVIFYFF